MVQPATRRDPPITAVIHLLFNEEVEYQTWAKESIPERESDKNAIVGLLR